MSIQGTRPTQWLRSGSRALDFAHSCGPNASLRVENLDTLGSEIQTKVRGLKSDPRFRLRCRRCRRRKKPVSLPKYDLSQQFKTIGPKMTVTATHRRLCRVRRVWGCSAVYAKQGGTRRPSYRLIKKAFRKRGERVWSFSNPMRLVRWTNSMVITRCGKHLLRRVKGTPMGASISPIKAEIATAPRERAGRSDTRRAQTAGHVRRGEDVAEVIAGVRIADDGVVASKLECPACRFSSL